MSDRCLNVDTADFSVFIQCEALGIVSPKACTSCRVRQAGKCPQGKEAL